MRPIAKTWLCRALTAEDAGFLQKFLAGLPEEDKACFHPHPFDSETITALCRCPQQDYYCGLFEGPKMIGYGMLRGWNEGFSIPSLGVVVGQTHRRLGCAQQVVNHLHAVARTRGAKSLRLTVYRANAKAVNFFQNCGYSLTPWNDVRLLGSLSLGSEDSPG